MLKPDVVAAALESLPGWERQDDRIVARFQFGNFVEAFAFMSSVALLSERADHHPEWSNVYGTVNIALTTHDDGGLSAKDLDLAAEISAVAAPASRG